jgi:hypothetical protein
MSNRPQATLYFGFSFENEYDENDQSLLDEYDWQEQLAARVGMTLVEGEYSKNNTILSNLKKEFDIDKIDNGDDNNDLATIGILSSVVTTDWDAAHAIGPDHPIFNKDQSALTALYCEKLQKFCDTMGFKFNIADFNCGWHIAAYYPSN